MASVQHLLARSRSRQRSTHARFAPTGDRRRQLATGAEAAQSPRASVRLSKILLARQRIAAGFYDEPAVLDAALTRMLDAATGDV